MSNKKITDLTELTTPTTDDVFPVVDIATNTTQKVQLGNLPTTPAVTSALASKQATLVSGTNIKTVNGTSVLGSGDINIPLTPPSGVSGAIQFSTGSAFASDAANLFWDDTNNRLGVGTNAPATALDLRGSLTIQRDATNYTMRLGSLGQINAVIDASQNNQFYLADSTFSNSFILNNLGTGFGVSPIASTKVAIKGSGTTSGTTSLLVQDSAGTELLRLRDDGFLLLGETTAYGKSFIASANLNYSGSVIGNNYLSETTGATTFGAQSSAAASALVDIRSTTRGFLPPRMTTTQKNAIATPESGLVVYDSTTNKLCCYNGSTWNDLF